MIQKCMAWLAGRVTSKTFAALVFSGIACGSVNTAQGALFDLIIDDSQARFSLFESGKIQTAESETAYGGSYSFITEWADSWSGTGGNNESGRVYYEIPDDVVFPAGERLYHIYAWQPAVQNDWHIINIDADGTDSFPYQNISWAGMNGTNTQYQAFQSGMPFDPDLGGRWVKIGPGPQADSTLTGDEAGAVYMNPTNGNDPRLYVKFQPFYSGQIIFDAIRIVEVGEEPALAGDLNGDGFVGQDDLNIILGNWGQTVGSGEWGSGDPSGDGFVGQDDLNSVLGGWGQGAPPVEAVPEPASIALGLIGCAGAALVAIRKRRA